MPWPESVEAALWRSYPYLPQRFIHRIGTAIARAERPEWLVQALIRAWIRIGSVDLADFEPRRYHSVEAFFLRSLRNGARPQGLGFTSPVDGLVVATGSVSEGLRFEVKGERVSLERLLCQPGGIQSIDLNRLAGANFATIFLSPNSYHRIHMPSHGRLVALRWIPGRFLPQNERARRHIHGVYEGNERVVLDGRMESGEPFHMVLVGAALVGGIHVEGKNRACWAADRPVAIDLARAKGDVIGHFTFGSTVIVFLPEGIAAACRANAGDWVRVGQPLFELASDLSPGAGGASS